MSLFVLLISARFCKSPQKKITPKRNYYNHQKSNSLPSNARQVPAICDLDDARDKPESAGFREDIGGGKEISYFEKISEEVGKDHI